MQKLLGQYNSAGNFDQIELNLQKTKGFFTYLSVRLSLKRIPVLLNISAFFRNLDDQRKIFHMSICLFLNVGVSIKFQLGKKYLANLNLKRNFSPKFFHNEKVALLIIDKFVTHYLTFVCGS